MFALARTESASQPLTAKRRQSAGTMNPAQNIRYHLTHTSGRSFAYQTDHRDTLVAPVLRILLPGGAAEIPIRGVNKRALEVMQTCDVRPPPSAQRAHAQKQEVSFILYLLKLVVRAWLCR